MVFKQSYMVFLLAFMAFDKENKNLLRGHDFDSRFMNPWCCLYLEPTPVPSASAKANERRLSIPRFDV